MSAIGVEALCRNLGTFTLGPLTFRIEPGTRAAVIGPSGAGKSTLLRVLAGLDPADRGRVHLGSELVTNGRVLVPPERRGIGFVFQDGALWPHLDARQHLTFVDPALGNSGADALLAQVGLAGKGERRPAQLSGGEGQRLALARALAGKPRLLLLDEPLRSVDVHLRDELVLLIRRIAAELRLTLVLVTHDRDEALSLADDLLVLEGGQLVERGSADHLLREPATAFTAAFLARAACLPARPLGGGRFATAFGEVAGGDGERMLVLLPGDVHVAAGPARGRVLGMLADHGTRLLAVEVEGQTLRVPVEQDHAPGSEVALALRRAPRLLPRGAKGGMQ